MPYKYIPVLWTLHNLDLNSCHPVLGHSSINCFSGNKTQAYVKSTWEIRKNLMEKLTFKLDPEMCTNMRVDRKSVRWTGWGDGIPVELFQIIKGDAVNMLHSICQQIWKSLQWPQNWKKSVFIPIPKKGNVRECSNYFTVALISHTSKKWSPSVMSDSL